MQAQKNQRLNTYLDPVLIQQTKLKAIELNKSVSAVIEDALKSYLPTRVKVEVVRETIDAKTEQEIDRAEKDITEGKVTRLATPKEIEQYHQSL